MWFIDNTISWLTQILHHNFYHKTTIKFSNTVFNRNCFGLFKTTFCVLVLSINCRIGLNLIIVITQNIKTLISRHHFEWSHDSTTNNIYFFFFLIYLSFVYFCFCFYFFFSLVYIKYMCGLFSEYEWGLNDTGKTCG
jgi:hypothetical protein